MSAATHTFSIESKINSVTGQPFGSKYSGTITIRRPSVADKLNIARKDAALRNAYGRVDLGQISDALDTAGYAHTFVSMLATEELPKWFDLAKIYDESDEAALFTVWEEVQSFLDTFRPAKNSGTGNAGGEKSAVLVPTDVPPTAD